MNIIIVGDGKVGYTLAQYLSQEEHDITVVDNKRDALSKAVETLDVMSVRGNGANVETLLNAGADTADMVIAVTTNDETNMVCCLAAKQLGAKYTIARIRDPEYTQSMNLLLEKLSIDYVINPENVAAYEISRLLRYPFADDIESFARGRVEMVEFRVKNGDPIIGHTLIDLRSKNPGALYIAAERSGEIIIPDGKFIPQADDRLFVLAELATLTEYFKRLGRSTQRIKSAILIGGSHIAYYLSRIVSGMGMRFKIIEIKPEKCRDLSEKLPDVVLINGDGTDQELLESENLSETDALICLTDRDEENLVTGLYASRIGVKKVIVKVDRISFMDVLGDMGIDSVVSPKLSTSNEILRLVRARSHGEQSKSSADKLYRFLDGQMEALEFTAHEGGSYCHIPLQYLPLKPGVLIAMLVRKRKVIIPFGEDHIEPGDTVLVVAKTHRLSSLEEALRS